jgi:hypothetical protein
MILLIDQSNEVIDLNEEIDLDISFDMHFSFSRDRFNELFVEKQLEVGKLARDLTNDECQDLIWALSDYIEEQLYDMYSTNLDQDGYIDEFINEQLPSLS